MQTTLTVMENLFYSDCPVLQGGFIGLSSFTGYAPFNFVINIIRAST